jgi:D-arabinose 1-dehydrogenase-like Zn-dependent alcohol dehydrogenase
MAKFEEYRKGHSPKQASNRMWPLYGAGIENLGQDGKMIEKPMPAFGPDELLVRHDACGLCFSDVKIIRLGQEHPRIYRSMQEDPVVMGHEVTMTVVGVGENLCGQYQSGDRFILQADIFVNGVGYAYGYEIQGGLSEYNVIDQRILNGDHGNYLIPIKADTGYAESALVEPWACVIAAYYLQYRTALKAGGIVWFIGPENGREFSLSAGLDAEAHPAEIRLTQMDGPFGAWLRKRAAELDIPVKEIKDIVNEKEPANDNLADDIILLDPTPDLIEEVSPYLTFHGMLVLATQNMLARDVQVDVGRIHYNRWLIIGGSGSDIAAIYRQARPNSKLKAGGKALFVGAGGPMGRMHVQRAIEMKDGPAVVICSDVSDERLADLSATFGEEARQKGINWISVNPTNQSEYEQRMAPFKESGFDDIIMLAPIPAVISDAAKWLAKEGVMNIFAGVARGTSAALNLNETIFNDVHFIGSSASEIEDMVHMLNDVESGSLSTNRSVAAIGSLEAVPAGLQAMMEARFPGKVVIFQQIKNLPLTGLPELKEVLPSVYSKLKNGHEWTRAAEEELINLMLKDEEG